MSEKKTERPDLLIERHIPVAEIGVECQREHSIGYNTFAPVNRLHVWWARRPLMAARAALLGSLLPPETDDRWFLRFLGIFGDPVAVQQRIQGAKATGEDLGSDPYGYQLSFLYTPDDDQLRKLQARIKDVWGEETIRVLDPMAGGGAIPFEAGRYGFETYANELNPVAYTILKGTIEYPAQFGKDLLPDLRKYGRKVRELAEPKLARFYPKEEGESIYAYVWARTVRCPECSLIVPLSPNWWLFGIGRTFA